jgi:hypothetical protein
MEDWKRQAAPQAATCPLCRHAWGEPVPDIHRFDQITERSFELYIEWLYTGQITVTPMPTERGTVPWTLAIVDAYALGTVIGDPAFCYALMRSLIEIVIEYHTYPGVRGISRVYQSSHGLSPLKTLLVGIYMNCPFQANDIFARLWSRLPAEFHSDLALAMIRRPAADVKTWTVEGLSRYLPERPPNAV